MQLLVNDLLINYKIFGEKNTNIIVILHGWRADSNSWVPIAKSLENDFKIVLIDLPGFGNSPRPLQTYGVYDYAKTIQTFLQKMSVPKCVLIGHSFGGRIAIVLSATTNLINKLVLVDSAGIGNSPHLYNIFINFISPIKKFIPRYFVNMLRNLLGSKDFLLANDMKDIFKKVVSEDLLHLLNKIRAPALIIWGNNDGVLDVKLSKTFKKQIRNSVVRIVWGAGHHPHLEKSEEFIEILKEYMYAT